MRIVLLLVVVVACAPVVDGIPNVFVRFVSFDCSDVIADSLYRIVMTIAHA